MSVSVDLEEDELEFSTYKSVGGVGENSADDLLDSPSPDISSSTALDSSSGTSSSSNARSRRVARIALYCVAAVLIVGACVAVGVFVKQFMSEGYDTVTPVTPAPSPLASLLVPRFEKIVVVVLENTAYESIVDKAEAPFLNELIRDGALMTKSYGMTHPSQPNYMYLFAGDNCGVDSNDCRNLTAPNLYTSLAAAGATFVGYSEDLPAAGSRVCVARPYARKHSPWASFLNVPASSNLPFTAFPRDYSQLPDVAFVTPNLLNDIHDGTIQQGDSWMRDKLGPLFQWAKSHNSLVIVTFDEDDKWNYNHVYTVLYGARITPGKYDQRIDHISVLKTILDSKRAAPVGRCALVDPIRDIWTIAPTTTTTSTTTSTTTATTAFSLPTSSPTVTSPPLVTTSVEAPSTAATTSSPAPATTSSAASVVPAYDKVIMVFLENTAFETIVGNSAQAPFLNELIIGGALMTQSYGMSRPSQPNYFFLFAGDNFGIESNDCYNLTHPNLYTSLAEVGRTFAGYSESLPQPGSYVCVAGPYARKHSPWVSFTNVPQDANRQFSSFPSNFSALPDVTYITPNLLSDMHDGTIQQGDAWMRSNLGPLFEWAKDHNSLVIVTFDEDDRLNNNHVYTLLYGAHVIGGRYDQRIEHVNVLRTILDAKRAPPVGRTSSVDPIRDVWGDGVCAQPKVDQTVIVVLASKGFGSIFGNFGEAPYLNALAAEGALLWRSYGMTHPSQPNMMNLFTGTDANVTTDECTNGLTGANMYTALVSKNKTFMGYAEGVPIDSLRVCQAYPYVRYHAPWASFANVPDSAMSGFAAFPKRNLSALPTVSFVVPDMLNNMHEGSITRGDAWIKANLEPLFQWSRDHNVLVVLTFDQDDLLGDNRIFTLFYGSMVQPGVYTQRVTHKNIGHTVMDVVDGNLIGGFHSVGPVKCIWKKQA